MKNQVLSIEQMRHLQELGVDTSKASMTWMLFPNEDGKEPELTSRKCCTFKEPFREEHCVPAFTLQDTLEMLPNHISNYDLHISYSIDEIGLWDINYHNYEKDEYMYDNSCSELLLLAHYTLCWCAENGYLEGGEK